jgi:hypothetical protein
MTFIVYIPKYTRKCPNMSCTVFKILFSEVHIYVRYTNTNVSAILNISMYFQNFTNHPFVIYFLKFKKLDRSNKVRLFLYYITETGIPKKGRTILVVSSSIQYCTVYICICNYRE